MAQKPLLLKDYLELDSWSDPFWIPPLHRAGGTTVRSLLEAELGLSAARKTGWKPIRSRSKAAVFNFLRASADTAGAAALLKKVGRSFFMKGKLIVKRGSLFYYNSPVFSRCSSSSEVISSDEISGGFFGAGTEMGDFVGAGEESRCVKAEEICGKVNMDCPFEEEKEQLSPVSVLDFLYRDEEEDETVSFEQNIINIERSKNQLLQKIRRFEKLANLDPVHLDHRFGRTKTHAETNKEEKEFENETPRQRAASALLRQLSNIDSLPFYSKNLLFDFFVEGYAADEELLRQASGWAAARRIPAEVDGHVAVMEVERRGGGWKRFAEEEEIVAVEMTGGVVTWLVEELVDDLLVSVG